MRVLAPVLLLFLDAALTPQVPSRASQSASTPAAVVCGPLGTAYMRTTLYFGLNRKFGNVSEAQWKSFLRDEVTPRFPQGLTVWQANGQWRRNDGVIAHERAKVLLLVHDDTAEIHNAINAIIERYKHRYDQESVLWETARVCAAF